MGVLKKSSKGANVEEVQKFLNKAGAKPKLEVDGKFGALTDKQTRLFQKKCKLKPDGKVGTYTLATLKYGKALPKLEEESFGLEDYSEIFTYVLKTDKGMKKLEKEFKSLAKSTVDKFIKLREQQQIDLAQKRAKVSWSKQIVAKRAEFEKVLLKNPVKAEKLRYEIQTLEGKFHFDFMGSDDGYWRRIYIDIRKDVDNFVVLAESITALYR